MVDEAGLLVALEAGAFVCQALETAGVVVVVVVVGAAADAGAGAAALVLLAQEKPEPGPKLGPSMRSFLLAVMLRTSLILLTMEPFCCCLFARYTSLSMLVDLSECSCCCCCWLPPPCC